MARKLWSLRADPSAAGPLFARSKGAPLFALLPSRLKLGGNDISIVNHITERPVQGQHLCAAL